MTPEQAAKKIRAAALRGLDIAAEHVLEESNRIVPHEEGTLERSGTVTVDRSHLTAAVSYDTPYAVRQHEDQDLNHKGKGEAKYLEKALDRSRRVVPKIIAAEVKRAMR